MLCARLGHQRTHPHTGGSDTSGLHFPGCLSGGTQGRQIFSRAHLPGSQVGFTRSGGSRGALTPLVVERNRFCFKKKKKEGKEQPFFLLLLRCIQAVAISGLLHDCQHSGDPVHDQQQQHEQRVLQPGRRERGLHLLHSQDLVLPQAQAGA